MKNKFKFLHFLVISLFVLLGFALSPKVEAADISDKVTLSNVAIKNNSTGTVTGTIWHPKGSTNVNVLFTGDFSFTGLNAGDIKNGDFFTVKAPDGIAVKDATLPLKDSVTGEVLGEVVSDSATGTLTFTFNEKVEDKQNVRGNFNVASTASTTGEDNTITYILPGGEQVIRFKPYDDEDEVPLEGEIIHKIGWTSGTEGRLVWEAKINRSGQNLTGKVVKIHDSIDMSNGGSLSTYFADGFSLEEVIYESTNTSNRNVKKWGVHYYKITTDPEVYQADSDKTALLTLKNGGTAFELLLPTNTGTKGLYLIYRSTTPGDGTPVTNGAHVSFDGVPQPSHTSFNGQINTNTISTRTITTVKQVGASVTVDLAGKIKITKYDEADANVKLKGVEFLITSVADPSKTWTVVTDDNGIALTPVLSNGKYTIVETKTKQGYVLDTNTVHEVDMTGEAKILNISNKRETVDFEATKTWVNGQATDYKEVTLGLYVRKQGEALSEAKPVTGNYTPVVTVADGVYTYRWENQLPKLDTEGNELVYSVRELDEAGLPLKANDKVKGASGADFKVSYNEDGTAVTNTYDVPKINVTANKTWVGGNDEKRPEVFFKLYQSVSGSAEEEVAGADVKAVPTTDGSVTWSDLPKTTEAGVEITYSVKEVTADGEIVTTVGGYTATQTDGLTVTNTYEAQPTTAVISATKELVGRQLNEGEFEFTLTDAEDGVVEKVKNAADGTVSFKALEFDTVGTYEYTITEIEGDVTGVTYDKAKKKVTITVKDNGEGKLVATVAYEGDEAKFVNTFEEPTTTTTTTEEPTTTTTTEEPTTTTTTEELTTTTTVEEPTTTTTTEEPTTTTTAEEPTTTTTTEELTTTTTVEEPTTTTTTEEPTTTTVEPTTTTTTPETTEAPTTSSTTTEATTTSETTSEATTTSSTTTEAPTTSTTTTEAPTTSSTTTEAPTTSTTTTEAPTTSSTTTEAPTTSETTSEATTSSETTTEATTTTVEPTTTTVEPTTTTVEPTTTTVEPTTTTVEPTTTTVEPTTTTVEPTTTTTADTTAAPGTTTQTPPPAAPKKGKILPKTGEESGLVTTLVGFALLAATGLAGFFYRKSKKA